MTRGVLEKQRAPCPRCDPVHGQRNTEGPRLVIYRGQGAHGERLCQARAIHQLPTIPTAAGIDESTESFFFLLLLVSTSLFFSPLFSSPPLLSSHRLCSPISSPLFSDVRPGQLSSPGQLSDEKGKTTKAINPPPTCQLSIMAF